MTPKRKDRRVFRAVVVRFARLICGIDAFFAARRRGGAYASSLKEAFAALRDKQISRTARAAAYKSILRYLFGERIAYRIIRDKAVCLTGVCLDADELYHFTPASKVSEIRKRGIRPKQWYVYLTDDPDAYREEFIAWKSYMRRRSERYVVLCIDAKLLCREQPIYRSVAFRED